MFPLNKWPYGNDMDLLFQSVVRIFGICDWIFWICFWRETDAYKWWKKLYFLKSYVPMRLGADSTIYKDHLLPLIAIFCLVCGICICLKYSVGIFGLWNYYNIPLILYWEFLLWMHINMLQKLEESYSNICWWNLCKTGEQININPTVYRYCNNTLIL